MGTNNHCFRGGNRGYSYPWFSWVRITTVSPPKTMVICTHDLSWVQITTLLLRSLSYFRGCTATIFRSIRQIPNVWARKSACRLILNNMRRVHRLSGSMHVEQWTNVNNHSWFQARFVCMCAFRWFYWIVVLYVHFHVTFLQPGCVAHIHLQVNCTARAMRSNKSKQAYNQRQWTVSSVSKGGHKLFYKRDQWHKMAQLPDVCVVIPISVSYYKDGERSYSHDIGCMYIKRINHLLIFDSLGSNDDYHRTAIKNIAKYVQNSYLDVVAKTVFVVEEPWQPDDDTLCVLDVWHFFQLYASNAQKNSHQNCVQDICKFYKDKQPQRIKLLKSWYKAATNAFDPELESAQPRSPTKRNRSSVMLNATPIGRTRQRRNSLLPSNTSKPSQESFSPDDVSVCSTTTQLFAASTVDELMEIDLDVRYSSPPFRDPSPPFRYSPLICRRKSCLFHQLNQTSHHRKLSMYIRQCMHVHP